MNHSIYPQSLISYVFFLIILLLCSLPLKSISKSRTPDNLKNPGVKFLELIFISNINGNIENCKCGNPSLGGLPQIATIVKKKRDQNPEAIFIDGGDFLNTYPYPILNLSILKIYQLFLPNFMVFGDQEFIETNNFTEELFQTFATKIIASNWRYDSIDLEKFSEIESINNKSIYFISYLDQNVIYRTSASENLHFDQNQFETVYNLFAENDFVVCLFHGRTNRLEWLINNFSKIDLILFSHEQSNIVATNHSPVIIGGGSDGEHVVSVKIFIKNNDFEYEVIKIPVDLEIEPNKEIQMLVDSYRKTTKRSQKSLREVRHRR